MKLGKILRGNILYLSLWVAGLLAGAGAAFLWRFNGHISWEDNRHDLILSEIRAINEGKRFPIGGISDYPRSLRILGGATNDIVLELTRLGRKSYFDRAERDWAVLLFSELAKRDQKEALRWFSDFRGYRFGDEMLNIVSGICVNFPDGDENGVWFYPSLPLQVRTSVFAKIVEKIQDPALRVNYLKSVPMEVIRRMYNMDAGGFFSLLKGCPVEGLDLVRGISADREGGALVASYLKYLLGEGGHDNIEVVAAGMLDLNGGYFEDILDKWMGVADLDADMERMVKMIQSVSYAGARGERLERLGASAQQAGMSLERLRESIVDLSKSEQNRILSSYVVALGELDIKSGMALLGELGGSEEVKKALDLMFARQPDENRESSFSVATGLTSNFDREIASQAAMRSWAGKDPINALSAALESQSVGTDLLLDSWVEGLKLAPESLGADGQWEKLIRENFYSYSGEDRDKIAGALKRKLTNQEMEGLPSALKLYLNRH